MNRVDDIHGLWLEFEKQIIDDGAGPEQRRDMKSSFYAGFLSCLDAVVSLGDDSISEEQASKALDTLYAEAQKHFMAYGGEVSH